MDRIEMEKQARAHKKAEVAGEVLSACFAALDGLRFVSDPWAPTKPANQSQHEWSRTVYTHRWETIADTLQRLHAAYGLALAYLDDEHSALVDEVQTLQRDVRNAQERWLSADNFGTDNGREYVAAGLGNAPKDRATELDKQLRKALVPIARLD